MLPRRPQSASQLRAQRAFRAALDDIARLGLKEIEERGYSNIAIAHGFRKGTREHNVYCGRIATAIASSN